VTGFKIGKTVRWRWADMQRGEFQLLGEDTEKVREPKEEIAQEGTSRRWKLVHVDCKHLAGLYTPWVKKGDTILLSISLLNIDRFSQFFHWRTQLEQCNKIINKNPTSPQMCCYTTLWNVPTRQCTSAQGTRDNQAAATGDGIHLSWSVASE